MSASRNETGKRIGKNIHNERKRQKLTQAQLAELIGREPKTVQRHEHGENLYMEIIIKYARALKCDPTSLLNCYDDPITHVVNLMLSLPPKAQQLIATNADLQAEMFYLKEAM